MRILSLILISALIGSAIGATIAYVEVGSSQQPVVTPQPLASELNREQKPEQHDDTPQPHVEVDEEVYDFGTMQRGTTKSHDFVFKNMGQAPLTLKVGQTSCKCTVGEVAGDSIPPGESVEVHLEWSAKTGMGEFRQTATIETNDPARSQVLLTVEGEVTVATGVSPSDLMFDKLLAGESKSAEVYVMAMLQETLDVGHVELSMVETRDFFEINVEPVEPESLPNPKARAGVRITVTAKPGLPIGRFDQWLVLQTNMPDAEKLEIPLMGRLVGDISIHGRGWSEEQATLRMGRVKSDQGLRLSVNIVVRGEQASDITFEVQTCDPPELQAVLGEPRRLKKTLTHVPMTIEIPAGTRPMARQGTAQSDAAQIVLKTSHPETPKMVLKVLFAVER